jgi:hypothetical protein
VQGGQNFSTIVFEPCSLHSYGVDNVVQFFLGGISASVDDI